MLDWQQKRWAWCAGLGLTAALTSGACSDNDPDAPPTADAAADVSHAGAGGVGGSGGSAGSGAHAGTGGSAGVRDAGHDGADASSGPKVDATSGDGETADRGDGAPESGASNCAADVASGGRAKNVIFFLGDGMGIPVLTAARIYAVGEEGSLTIDTLPETGFVRTYSKNYMVTDSAPSMSAYMTGVKMNQDVIAMSDDTVNADGHEVADLTRCAPRSAAAPAGVSNGTAVPTILEAFKQAGKAVGVVTTTRVTHATPAATYAHVCNRDFEGDIAAQAVPGGAGYNAALGDGLDVLFGGGRNLFVPQRDPAADVTKNATWTGMRLDNRDLTSELTARGFVLLSNAAELRAHDQASGKKVVGLFTGSHMSYEVDRDDTREPSLAEMTVDAINILKKNSTKGFFLMVEGGRIDHALHETRVRRALEETVAFDKAIAGALAAVDLSDTLVVVTADHDHSMIHNGYARRVGKTTPTNAGILGFVHDYQYRGDAGAPAKLDRDGVPYTILGFTNGPNRVAGPRVATGYADLTAPDAGAVPLTEDLTSSLDYRAEATIRMPSDGETHGGTDVSVYATGASSEQVHGFFTNTELYKVLRCGAGL